MYSLVNGEAVLGGEGPATDCAGECVSAAGRSHRVGLLLRQLVAASRRGGFSFLSAERPDSSDGLLDKQPQHKPGGGGTDYTVSCCQR